MKDKEIIDSLKELKKSTSDISKMLQLLLYKQYFDDGDDEKPDIKLKRESKLNDSYRSYFG